MQSDNGVIYLLTPWLLTH